MTLQDIASSTKIQPKFIEALETDNYTQLPKGPFIIGFLRSYAESLSLDADEVIAFFQAHHGHRIPKAPVQPRQPLPPASPQISWPRVLILCIGLATLICVFLLNPWTGFLKQSIGHEQLDNRQVTATSVVFPPSVGLPEDAGVNATTPPAPSPSAAVIKPDVVSTEPRRVERASPAAPAGAVSEGTSLEPMPLILRIQALEETWMRLDIDDESRQEALIQAGQSIERKAKRQFSLTLGNVKGARVLLNDQELDLPVPRSNVLRDYVLTRTLLNPRRTD
jgi:cytoskeletal protein RodZ